MLARLEGPAWHIVQASDWHYRWDFHGGGTLHFEIQFGPVTAANGALTIAIQHQVYGDGTWSIDPATLRLTAVVGRAALTGAASSSPTAAQFEAQSTGDASGPRQDGVRYRLLWQTLPENRDQPRPGAPPPPSMLRLSVGR
jgi:hypothetical protein